MQLGIRSKSGYDHSFFIFNEPNSVFIRNYNEELSEATDA